MTRILLVAPPSPEARDAPLLGQQYVAAAFLERGCDVRVIDAAARGVADGEDSAVHAALAWEPDLVGMGLFTRWVGHAYRLAGRLRGRVPLLVAGGPHATVRPREALERGFDLAVIGEAESVVPALVDAVEGRGRLGDVPGIVLRSHDGSIRTVPPAPRPPLNALPSPLLALDLYDPGWYGLEDGVPVPGGLLTSRGCPARCTFCANQVTGRTLRTREPADVVAEVEAWHARTGHTFFAIWDDSFTASAWHVAALCRAFEEDVSFPLRWSAITRADRVTPDLLRAMRRAGCMNVMFGAESGDAGVLRAIRKGLTPERVERSLRWAKDEGLTTTVSVMLGFPGDTPRTLRNTLDLLQRNAPLVDAYSPGGVVIPLPGTPIYEENHARYGFTDWWLDERSGHHDAPPPIGDVDAFTRWYLDDVTLALDFFRYDDETRAAIRECLRFKGEHNLRRMGVGAVAEAG